MTSALAAAGGAFDLPSWATLLTALAGIAGVTFAFLGTRRGQNIEAREKRQAVVLEDRVQGLKELEVVLAERKAELAEVRAARVDDQKQHTEELTRVRAAARREVERVEARCSRQIERIIDAADTLRAVVISEVASTAASEAIGVAKRHLEVHAESAAERALEDELLRDAEDLRGDPGGDRGDDEAGTPAGGVRQAVD